MTLVVVLAVAAYSADAIGADVYRDVRAARPDLILISRGLNMAGRAACNCGAVVIEKRSEIGRLIRPVKSLYQGPSACMPDYSIEFYRSGWLIDEHGIFDECDNYQSGGGFAHSFALKGALARRWKGYLEQLRERPNYWVFDVEFPCEVPEEEAFREVAAVGYRVLRRPADRYRDAEMFATITVDYTKTFAKKPAADGGALEAPSWEVLERETEADMIPHLETVCAAQRCRYRKPEMQRLSGDRNNESMTMRATLVLPSNDGIEAVSRAAIDSGLEVQEKNPQPVRYTVTALFAQKPTDEDLAAPRIKRALRILPSRSCGCLLE